MTDAVVDVSEPYDNPRKYEIIADAGFMGMSKGETIVRDAKDGIVVYGLEHKAIRLLNEPASIDDNGN